ncbi:MAG: excinuclease ABC subunit UvrC [Spirochaetaceae bacterium]|nr:excinuclease ABC subunit UvrC [Spirochaetaceae bacterium]
MEKKEHLKKIAYAAPLEPGVYLWRDEENRIIYIGKAKILRNRLQSYFRGTQDLKTKALILRAESIETIITATEYEALLLEQTLIKQHYPRYNISLKDGKSYPLIRITAETFPRVFKTRRIMEDGSQYFGPYPNARAVDAIVALADKLFRLRKCKGLRKRNKPCLYFHIDRCTGPCCGKVSPETYGEQLADLRNLLAGLAANQETDGLIIALTERMHEEAKALRFERAVLIRDAVQAIESFAAGASVIDADPEGRDYIAWAEEGTLITFAVFSLRGGKLMARELFRSRSVAEEQESLETFLAAYYSPDSPPPQRIFTSLDAPLTSMERWFTERFGYAPAIQSPRENRHAAVLAMARQNALEDLRRRVKSADPALDELARVLGLKTRPERIEGFDIAQLNGKHPVASLVSFKHGIPDKKQYRHFKLRTVIGVIDDFGAMREAVRRRYARLAREGGDLPDFVLVDGGIGQVRAAKAALDELGLNLDVAGLAKRNEEIYLPESSQPIRLSRRSEALKILQFVRDESHRFATALNQRLRAGDVALSVLESVPGIGAKRAELLLRTFGGLEEIAAADLREIARTAGINEQTAAGVRRQAYRRKTRLPRTSGGDLAAEALGDSSPENAGGGS